MLRLAASAIALALLSGACASTPEKPPNVVWVIAEDISPAMGVYGDEQAHTPTIDGMAAQGVTYARAHTTAPICSPSRSGLVMGMYATSVGTQHLRSEVERPDSIETVATYLKKAGYFTTIAGKTDYNFDPDGIYDVWTSEPAPWRKRAPGQPFYSKLSIGKTHEGSGNKDDKHAQAVAGLPDALKRDPADVILPPFYPDTAEMRRIFAGYQDLITEFDRKTLAQVLDDLQADGLLEDTFVFFMADHGYGLPRYKRWLGNTGLHVPLVVRVPENYRHLSPESRGTKTDRLTSFIDVAPTTLALAGVEIPEHMPGLPFMGPGALVNEQGHALTFGARDRADDMYDLARSVFDGRYIYIRHYMPHLPYIQPGVIFGDQKSSLRELRRLHEAGDLEGVAASMWEAKPGEELYDLQADPYEMNNLAEDPEHAARKAELAGHLRDWILAHQDTGFLHESEMHIRARALDTSIYEMAQSPRAYDLPTILAAAERVGDAEVPTDRLIEDLDHEDSGVRYWGATALLARGEAAEGSRYALAEALADPSPAVRVTASEALCRVEPGLCGEAVATLGDVLQDDRPWVALHAARALALLGERAAPATEVMQAVREANLAPPGSERAYKDFVYASFTGWALEWALAQVGEPVPSGGP